MAHKHKWGGDTDYTNIHYSSAPQRSYTGRIQELSIRRPGGEKLRSKSWSIPTRTCEWGNLQAPKREAATAEGRSPSRLGVWGIYVRYPSGAWASAPETKEILSISCQNVVHIRSFKS